MIAIVILAPCCDAAVRRRRCRVLLYVMLYAVRSYPAPMSDVRPSARILNFEELGAFCTAMIFDDASSIDADR